METDAQRMALLEKDPEEGMAAIMEQYGGLVWAVAARRLSNEEDVRECVNETFAQFYFEQSRYQPEKGSLGGWLARIAQRRAVDKWRAGRRFEGEELPENLAAPAGLGAEDRLDLEEALARLSPQDAEILRMKYFAGMTAKEIAAALDLPYETVKKRQQRGLERLRRMLIVGLVLALLALLAACGYALLRYFGVLPGYGVNTDPESSFAILARDVYQENDLGSVELSDGVWDGDRLSLTIQLSRGPGTEATMPMVVGDSTYPVSWDLYLLQDASLSLGGESYRPTMTVMDASRSTADSLAMELVFEGLPRPKGQAAVASLEFSWLSLPFVLDTAQEISPEEFVYGLGELGGVLAIPTRSQTGVAVELYPLDGENFAVDPGIISGRYDPAGDEATLTLIDREGGRHEGRAARLSSYGSDQYSRWEFGDLEPGEYTLHIPGLMLTAVLPQDVRIPVAKGEQQVLELPGASLEMQISGEFPPAIASGLSEGGTGARFFVSFALAGREDLTLEGLTLSAGTELPAPESFVGGWSSCRVLTDDAGAFAGLDVEFAREAMSASPFLTTGSGNTFTCWWEHPFELKIQVPS